MRQTIANIFRKCADKIYVHRIVPEYIEFDGTDESFIKVGAFLDCRDTILIGDYPEVVLIAKFKDSIRLPYNIRVRPGQIVWKSLGGFTRTWKSSDKEFFMKKFVSEPRP